MKKNLKVLSIAILAGSLAAAGVVTATYFGGGLKNVLPMHAEESNTMMIRVSAADIAAGIKEGKAGEFVVSGMKFHVDGASVAGSTVTISQGTLYNVDYSGSAVSANKRAGAGFHKVVINNMDSKTGANSTFFDYGEKNIGGQAIGAVSQKAYQLNTVVDGTNAKKVFFAFGAGEGTSFSSIDFYYTCEDATPKLSAIKGANAISAGEDITLEAVTKYATKAATFEWSTSSDAVSIKANGKTATIHGEKGGDAVVTCKMTDGAVVASLTHAINVKAQAATKKEVVFLDTCAVEGAGVFVRINAKAMGLTFEQLEAMERTLEITTGSFSITGNHFQGAPEQRELYITMNGAPVGNPLAIKVTFKDPANNVVYEGTVNFKGDKVALPLNVSGATSVKVGATAEVKAEKGFYLDGDATFAFESKNPELFTVTANGGVATIKGVAKGQGKLAITMTLAGKTYTAERAITVSQPSEAKTLKVNSGKIVGAGMTLMVDNSALKMTMANANAYQFKAKFTISYIGDGESQDACTPYLGDDKVLPNNYVVQNTDNGMVQLYITMNIGLNETWPVGWDVRVDVTDPSGEEYVIRCHFRQTTFGDGALS
ncbi:MAG: hypothetical protein ACI4QP_07625 [Candidatus Enteromonas sp.]